MAKQTFQIEAGGLPTSTRSLPYTLVSTSTSSTQDPPLNLEGALGTRLNSRLTPFLQPVPRGRMFSFSYIQHSRVLCVLPTAKFSAGADLPLVTACDALAAQILRSHPRESPSIQKGKLHSATPTSLP